MNFMLNCKECCERDFSDLKVINNKPNNYSKIRKEIYKIVHPDSIERSIGKYLYKKIKKYKIQLKDDNNINHDINKIIVLCQDYDNINLLDNIDYSFINNYKLNSYLKQIFINLNNKNNINLYDMVCEGLD